MNLEGTGIVELIPHVLSAWDIVPDDVSPISGSGNRHWRVRRGRDGFVLTWIRRIPGSLGRVGGPVYRIAVLFLTI